MRNDQRVEFFASKQRHILVLLLITMLFGKIARAEDPEVERMLDSVKTEIVNQGILYPEIVLRQSIWESGWYKCTQCSWRFNNPFGFRHKSWVTDDNPQGYLKFDTWQDAVAYYKKWQTKRYKGGDYYQFLIDVGYAADGELYVSHLKSLNI